ncbi:MAG: recombinase family protein [Anaerolineae bacterium]
MAMAEAAEGVKWLSLQQASELLGVHPATLRQWADRGKIRVFRTPGGHRRFAEEDVQALLQAKPRPDLAREVELLVQSALGRTRWQVGEGRLANESWYRRFDEPTRKHHRVLGRRLLGLLMRYLSDEGGRSAVLGEARDIGREYGDLALRRGLSLSEALRAFLFFRDFLLESVLQLPSSTVDVATIHHQINAFVDQVLLAMVEACEGGGKGQ